MPVRSRLRVQERLRANARSLFLYRQGTSALLFPNPSHFVTAPFRVASDKETAQWAFSASSLRQQERLHRPLPMVGSGVPAAATFCESLADADDAALMRLFNLCLCMCMKPSICIFLFAPRLHHEKFADCSSLAGYRVHFYRETALGTLFFRGIKSSFAMFLHLVG